MYPNPSTGVLVLNVPANIVAGSYTLTTASGKVIGGGNLATNKSELVLDLGQHAKGIYFLNLRSSQGTLSKKVVLH